MRRMTAGRIPAELQPTINRMTGWQRSQWASAGYPTEKEAVERYAKLDRKTITATPIFRSRKS